ncbi:Uncharacterised protein [Ectopseudomonas mendocina]|uniref:Uncharacterized protein n=1 Tax=Ectopseudomonas mendocina TaxID=300 RepID=A0A379ISL7_ECTME|nr:Uncharacterised protein [Pseudomonas mendocina]
MDSNDGHISIFDWWYHPHSRIGWMTLFSSTIAVAAPRSVCVNSPLRCCCRYRFRSYSGSLLANAPKVSKRSCPWHPARLRRVPSFHRCSRGTPRRAIPGPSRLSRHPCRSTPYTTIPLGLLTGRLASSARLVLQNLGAKALRSCRNALALLFDSSHAPAWEPARDALRRSQGAGRQLLGAWRLEHPGCIPTRSVGMIKFLLRRIIGPFRRSDNPPLSVDPVSCRNER